MTGAGADERRLAEGHVRPAGAGDQRGAAPAPVSLSRQIDEVGREIRHREQRYPDLVARGRLKPETAAAKLDALRAAQRTLEWLALHEGWIRREAAMRAAEERARAQRELDLMAAEDSPEVAAVRAVFPDAEIADVRRLDNSRYEETT